MAAKHSVKKYALEVLQPDKQGFVMAYRIDSDEPFLAIHKGDTLNPSTWNLYCFDSVEAEETGESNYGTVLKVTGIEHSLVQREDGSIKQHKTAFLRFPSRITTQRCLPIPTRRRKLISRRAKSPVIFLCSLKILCYCADTQQLPSHKTF